MSDDLVERIARAIHDVHGSAAPYEPYAEDWCDMARAALEAITAAGYVVVPREPTEAMRSEGSCFGGFDGEWQRDNTARIWQAMIDAALKSSTPA